MAKGKPIQTPVKSLAGKSAVFVRGFGEHLRKKHNAGQLTTPLRATQDAGLLFVSSKGDTISVPYISQLTGRMEHEGFFEKERMGKSYMLKWTDESIEPLLELLANDNFGTSVAAAEVTVDDLKARNGILNHLKAHQGVVITNERPVPKAAYKVLWDRFNKGELTMGFFTPAEGKELAEDYPQFVHASVHAPGDNDE